MTSTCLQGVFQNCKTCLEWKLEFEANIYQLLEPIAGLFTHSLYYHRMQTEPAEFAFAFFQSLVFVLPVAYENTLPT
jgi:hypothetical protein